MAATITPAFHHGPLNVSKNQIRLLRIITAYTEETLISIRLETYDLESAPPYIALSYAWEDPDPQYQNTTYPINVDGASLQVGRTLHAALIELRDKIQELSEDSPLLDFPLWVDQISIDQLNVTERNHQVMMMASIYQNAERVIVWLFEAHLEPGDPEMTRLDLDDRSDNACMERISTAFRATYWKRLWVVQEILLGKERHVLCAGGTLISWPRMGELHNRYKHIFVNESVYTITELLYESLKIVPMPLSHAIDRFCTQQCKDPRDKVYALQGIVDEENRVAVDYHKSVYAVYVDTIRVLHEVHVQFLARAWDAYAIYRGHNQRCAMAGNDLQNQLDILARELGLYGTFHDQAFTNSDRRRQGVAAMLKDLFHGHRNTRLLNCIATDRPMEIGYVEEAFCDSASSSIVLGRWWAESDGERRYY